MTKVSSLRAEFVEYIPARGEPGIIYVSQRFRTAMHLCCCGCGMEVVTPLNSAKWTLTQLDAQVSLRPSIGNWSFDCRSHYWIERGKVRWAGPMSEAQIRQVRRADAFAAQRELDVSVPSPSPAPTVSQPAPQRANWVAMVKQWVQRLFR